ncbi:hypothetical protein GTW71_00225, partial [Streptomyces sp. SID6041]|nr:hypothetical protein [Streptomyces sp. SID6041]
MEQPIVSGMACDSSGTAFAVIGMSNTPADWAKIFRSLADAGLRPGLGPEGGGAEQALLRAVVEAAGSAADHGDTAPAAATAAPATAAASIPSMSMTPPSVL